MTKFLRSTIKIVQRIFAGISVLLYIAAIDYFLKYRNIIIAYNNVPVPAWAIPAQVKHFIILLQLTAIFAAISLSFVFICNLKRC